MPARSPALLTPAEALDALCSPAAADDLTAARGIPLVVVDGDWAPITSPAVPESLDRLRDLPAVTVAVARSRITAAGALLAAGFDVLLVAGDEPALDGAAPAAAFEGLVAAVEANPQASLVLAQVLRSGAGGYAGLLTESLAYGLLQSGPELASWLADHERPDPPQRARPPVRVARAGDRVEVVLDGAEVRNAIDAEVRDGLVEAFTAVAADPTVATVVLRGEGPSFSSGGALWEFGTVPDPPTGHVVRSTRLPGRALLGCASRLRVQVHGRCVGAGVELPAFAATVVAAPDATFRLPEVGMGLIPGAGGTVSLPRRIGRQRTAFLALTGQEIDAPTAQSWGLVDQLS